MWRRHETTHIRATAHGIRLVSAIGDVLLQGNEEVEVRLLHLDHIVSRAIFIVNHRLEWVQRRNRVCVGALRINTETIC